MMSRIRSAVAAVVCLVLLPGWAIAQQDGTITGRVVDSVSQQPIASAQVRVVGTTLGALTSDRGEYRITGVRPGTVTLRAQRIGYAAKTMTVQVPAGGSVTADFALEATAAQIDEVVITASGEEQRRRESGVSVGRIDADALPKAAINNFSDVLSARAPGVTVQSAGGTAGTGSRIRIRGSNSVSLANDPIIIIDGVRVNNDANSTSIGVGGQQPSRFDDLNTDDIADIQIIKGPAAAALYGTAASNGVIQITTKRGQAGKTRWEAYASYGPEHQVAHFPDNARMFGRLTDSTHALTSNCNIIRQASGVCTADSLVAFNPLEAHSPFIDGWREGYGLAASGGGRAATYYVAGDYAREQGVYEPNKLRRINLRANLHGQLRDNLDVTVTTNYLQSRLGLPQNDNNSEGVISGGLLGGIRDDSVSFGYLLTRPEKLFKLQTQQDLERFTGGVAANYQPLSWLKGVFQAGIDYTTRYDHFLVEPGIFTPDEDPDAAVGERASNPYQIWDYTANGGVTGTFQLTPSLLSTTRLGVQYHREFLHGTEAFGERLTPGTSSLNGANALFTVDETSADIITIGGYLQQEFGWHDRVFLSAGLRTDRNSAFGIDFKNVFYPSVNLSWVIGEEPFFPDTRGIVSSLQLRAAYGESGQNPQFRSAITFFNPTSVAFEQSDLAGITIGGAGNEDLRPEVSREYELGFEAGLFDDRLNADFTYYHKTTHDALVAQRLAPSLGVADTRFINIGKVLNRGFELLLNGTVVKTDPARLDLTVSGSLLKNELLDLGTDATGKPIPPIIFGLGGDTQRHQNGFPLGGYWQRPILGFNDDNGDGIIAPDELQIGDSAVFLGQPYPKRELSISPRLTLFKYVELSGLLDYQGGQKLYNSTEDFRCGSNFLTCRAVQDKTSPLSEQARAVANVAFSTVAGYIEDASFWKLRELAVTLHAPTSWATRAGVSGLSLTLAGRNLHTWTKYTGLDPELNEAGQSNFTTAEFLTQPPIRYYTVRLNVNW